MSSVSVIGLDSYILSFGDQKFPTTMTVSTWNRESSKMGKVGKRKMGRKNHGDSEGSSQFPQNQVMNTFFPMRILLQILGRFPFHPTTKKESEFKNNTNLDNPTGKKCIYAYSILTFHWLYFVITTIVLVCILCLVSMAFANIFLEWDFPTFLNYPKFIPEEKKLFEKNLVPFVLFWSCLIHSTVGSISFIRHRNRIVDYLNEWETFVETLNLELPRSIRNFLLGSNFWYVGFLVGVIFFHAFKILRIAVGGAELIGVLCMKPFVVDVMNASWFNGISILAVGTLVYSMYSSRALLFLYAYKCRLLKYAFKMWNKQLNELLTPSRTGRTTSDDESYDTDEEVNCQQLYKEHFILTNMVRQTDKIFGGILQSYYASQILNMCFELYYLARSGTFPSDDSGTNQGDIIAAIMLLVQNIYIFFTVSLDAAYVNDEALRGVEILRARGTQPNDSIHKKYLVQSLNASFYHRIVMTGGKFFYIDRPFIITVLGAVCTYFVIILQYGDNLIIRSI